MEKISPMSSKILVPGLLILALAVASYFYFAKDDIANLDDLGDTEPLGQDILVLAEKLDTLSIDASVFSSILFTTLKDLSTPLTPESQGRPNPFAAIGLENSVSTVPTIAPRPSGR